MDVNNDTKSDLDKLSTKDLKNVLLFFCALFMIAILTVLYLVQPSFSEKNMTLNMHPYLKKGFIKRGLSSITVSPFVYDDLIFLCYQNERTFPDSNCISTNDLQAKYEFKLSIKWDDAFDMKISKTKEIIKDTKVFENYVHEEIVRSFKIIDDYEVSTYGAQ